MLILDGDPCRICLWTFVARGDCMKSRSSISHAPLCLHYCHHLSQFGNRETTREPLAVSLLRRSQSQCTLQTISPLASIYFMILPPLPNIYSIILCCSIVQSVITNMNWRHPTKQSRRLIGNFSADLCVLHIYPLTLKQQKWQQHQLSP